MGELMCADLQFLDGKMKELNIGPLELLNAGLQNLEMHCFRRPWLSSKAEKVNIREWGR
jgi:hypothetical protein